MKRIVKETLSNGNVQFVVETNRCFGGLFPCKWHTDSVLIIRDGCEFHVDAIYNTLKEAYDYGIAKPKVNVTKREIVG